MKTTNGNRLPLLLAMISFVLGVLGGVCSIINLVRKSDRRALILLVAIVVMIVSPFLMCSIGTAIWGP